MNKNIIDYEQFKKMILEADISQFNLKELVAQNKIKELQALSDALAGFTNTFIGTVQLEVSRSNFAKQEKS